MGARRHDGRPRPSSAARDRQLLRDLQDPGEARVARRGLARDRGCVADERRGRRARLSRGHRGFATAGDVALTETSSEAAAKPMRLVFVAHPNSIHTRRWTAWFARAGQDVTVLDPVGVEVEPGIDGVAVQRVASSRFPGWLGRRQAMRRALADLRPDVVHAHYLARFGWTAALSGTRPLVVTPWGSDLLQVRRGQLRTRLWNRFALRRADLVTVSSEGMRVAAVAAGARR